MSPDDIFAAQFWPWPDPALKRDPQGRVLFVNAAFLALYGGQVDDWRGNAVGGWPAPQAAPYRFETRLPAEDGSEQVYDWMEQILADGNAFALARNVTVFTQVPSPDPANISTPAQTEQALAHQQAAGGQNTAANEAQPVLAQQTQAEPVAQAPVDELSLEDTNIDIPPLVSSAAEFINNGPEAEAIQVPEIAIPEINIPSDDAYAMTEAPVEPAAQPPVHAPEMTPAMAPAQEVEREFERRALPIEDEDSVLGNNWRDAVIAKAVGADDVAPDATATNDSSPEAAAETPDAGSESGSARILLAEDNAINALLTRTLLEAEGHTVDTVEDGALAVEAMKTAQYDLIFMDMRMPNMDGLEATRKIRTLPNVSKALPIIALTANAFDDDRNACFDSGMNDFMTKPVSAEELSEKVENWTSEEAKARMLQAA